MQEVSEVPAVTYVAKEPETLSQIAKENTAQDFVASVKKKGG